MQCLFSLLTQVSAQPMPLLSSSPWAKHSCWCAQKQQQDFPLSGTGANIYFGASHFFLVFICWAPGIVWCWQICRSGLHFVALREWIQQQQNRSQQNSPVKLASGDRGNLQPWLMTGRRAAIQVSHFILDKNFSFQSLPKRSVLGMAFQTVTLKGNQCKPWGFVWRERWIDTNWTETTGSSDNVRILSALGKDQAPRGKGLYCRLRFPPSIWLTRQAVGWQNAATY